MCTFCRGQTFHVGVEIISQENLGLGILLGFKRNCNNKLPLNLSILSHTTLKIIYDRINAHLSKSCQPV